MTEEQVIALVGEPDDIVTRAEVGVMNDGADTIWCYGTDGHETFPTLGRIYFCQGVTTTVCGQLIAPPPDLPPRPVLSAVLDAVAVGDGGYYNRKRSDVNSAPNPRWLIDTVNALRHLGKAQALAVLREYVRLTDGGDAPPFDQAGHVAQICEVLFGEPADGAFPDGLRPAGLARPRVVDGVPLLIPVKRASTSQPQPPTAGLALRVLAFYVSHGALRSAPLVPIAGASAVWAAARRFVSESGAAFVHEQVVELFGSGPRSASAGDSN